MSETFQLTIPAKHRYLKLASVLIGDILTRENRVDEATTYDIELAVQEIAANIIDHAYSENVEGRIDIEITLHNDPLCLIVDLADTGRAFYPAQISSADTDEAHNLGYGLHLANKLMDDVRYQQTEVGNQWRLVKYLPTG
ncbi:MAG: ATP-binding protein [Anaerolineae bacterium]